jgi:outer membrane protein assembly factor BamB
METKMIRRIDQGASVMKKTSILTLALAVFAVYSGINPEVLEAGQWSSFKASAARQGVSGDASIDLPLKISWKYALEGKTNGFVDWGPVAADGVVYTGDGLNHILALNAETGELIWKKDLVSNIFSVSLSDDAKKLYVTIAITTKPTPTLFALDPKTGEILWDNMVNDQPAVGGIEGAPAIADGKIFAGYLQYEGHGGLIALDGETGALLWHIEVTKFSPYSPITYADGRLYVGFENKTLYCVDAATGKNIWSKQTVDLPYAAPLAWDKKVYVGTGNTIYAMDAASGQVMWEKQVEAQIGHSSLSVYDKTLYVGSRDSKVFALTAGEGSVIWTQDLQKGPIESSVLVDAKKKLLFVATQENKLLALGLKTGEVKDELVLSEDPRGVWKSSPALYGGRLYVGSLDKTFYAVE